MSRRQIIKKYPVLSSADSSTDPESSPTDVSSVDHITYQFELDSSVDAVAEIVYCNDAVLSDLSVFEALNFRQPLTLDGSVDTDGLIHIANLGFKWMKLKITNSGGTGDISAWITGTVEGA